MSVPRTISYAESVAAVVPAFVYVQDQADWKFIEVEPGWHVSADHDDAVAVLMEGSVVLFLVVVVVGAWTWMGYTTQIVRG